MNLDLSSARNLYAARSPALAQILKWRRPGPSFFVTTWAEKSLELRRLSIWIGRSHVIFGGSKPSCAGHSP
jgi:hypothetical protein